MEHEFFQNLNILKENYKITIRMFDTLRQNYQIKMVFDSVLW